MADIPLTKPELKNLFTSIGSESRLNLILEKFYQRMSQDILIGFFFEGKDLKQIAHTQASFLLRAMGVTSSYSGKAPAQAHDKLPPILAGHFDRRLRLLEEVLKEEGLSDKDIKIWVLFESAFRASIVKS
jgi:truncated hemoglobin YjbI